MRSATAIIARSNGLTGALLVLIYFACGICSTSRADSSITVNSNVVLQRIDGFGASDAWEASNIRAYSPPLRREILDDLFSTKTGAGLSILRHLVSTQIEPAKGVWDWSKESDTAWLNDQAIRRGVKTVWSSPYSPPGWMKTSDDVDNGGPLAPEHYQDYADYLATYVKQYDSRFGIDIADISVQNEPDNAQPYPSCVWSGQQLHDFLAGYLIPTFKRDNITAGILLPESSTWRDDLAAQTLADPTTAAAVKIIAAHAYWSTIGPLPDALKADKVVWQSEVSNLGHNDDSIVDALHWALSIHDALVLASVSAWHYWWLCQNLDSSGQGLINGDAARTKIEVNKRLWSIGNFSRFVRPGFHMIGLSSNNPEAGVYVSAFLDDVGKSLVVVAINMNSGSTRLSVNLQSASQTIVQRYRTSATENLAMLSSVFVTGSVFSSMLDGSSVTTFVLKRS